MKLALISDTHGQHDGVIVPEADVLVHAGDFTNSGSARAIAVFSEWLEKQPHKHIVVIAGNHDIMFEQDRAKAQEILCQDPRIHYLQDEGMYIDGKYFYGTPWVQMPTSYWAFCKKSETELAEHWSKIPAHTDVLITHGPPANILDADELGQNAGSVSLLAYALKIQPKVHVFGHIHESYGATKIEGVRFVNAAQTQKWITVKPIVVEI